MAHKAQRFHNKQPDKGRKIQRERTKARCPHCGSKGQCVFFPNMKIKPSGGAAMGPTWCACSNCGRKLFRIATPAERNRIQSGDR